MTRITNLTYILNDNNEVLLIKVIRGVGKGYWNAPGGKVEGSESLEAAARREVEEEAGVKVFDLISMGVIEFVAPEKPEIGSRCYIYITTKYEGTPHPTDEGIPKWFKIDQLLYDEMWAADRYWLPQVLEKREKVFKRFYLDKNEKIIKIEDLKLS